MKAAPDGMNESSTGTSIDAELTQLRSPGVPGYVYFLRSGDAIKIGFSVHPIKRVNELQIGNPEELELLCAVEGMEQDEKRLHAEFSHLEIRSEWFRAEDDLLDYIDSLAPLRARHAVQRQRNRMTPETAGMLSKLAKLRMAHGAETLIGYRCSNLSEMIPNFEAETNPEARARLAVGIEKQTADLLRFMADAN